MQLDEAFTTEDIRDLPEVRYLELDNGNRAVFERDKNAYGFWTVRFESGGKPEAIAGSYTSYDLAKAAFHKYLAEKNTKRYTEVNVKKPKKSKKTELFDKE